MSASRTATGWDYRVQWREPGSRRKFHEYCDLCLDMLEQRDPGARQRAFRVEAACRAMGVALRLSHDELFGLSLAARFHELGLLSATQLTDGGGPDSTSSDDDEMHRSRLGAALIAKAYPDFPEAAEGIWYARERPDGTGPYRLRGPQIPRIANVVALIREVDRRLHPATGEEKPSAAQIAAMVEQAAGSRLLPDIVAAFKSVANEVLVALSVETGVAQPPSGSSNSPEAARCGGGGPRSPAGGPSVARNARSGGVAAGDSHRPVSVAPSRVAEQSSPTECLGRMNPLVTREELAHVFAENLELRPLATTAQSVLAATQNAQCSAVEVAHAVVKDQALSIRILRLANGSVYSRGKPVQDVNEAVRRIGVQEVRKLVLTLDIVDQYRTVNTDTLDARLLWEHSLACGVIASGLARIRGAKTTDDYFLWGMLHDVGRLVLAEHLPEQYGEAVRTARALGLPLEKVEARLLLTTHCELLRKILEKWNFPKDFAAPMSCHHETVHNIARLGPPVSETAATLALADRLAHALLIGNSANDILQPFDDLARAVGVTHDEIDAVVNNARTETDALKFTMLASSHVDDWPDSVAPLLGTSDIPFAPLCFGRTGEIDACLLCCRRLAAADLPPTAAILYVREARDLEAAVRRCEAREREQSLNPLPVVLVSESCTINADHAWLKSRRHVLLKMPLGVRQLVEACRRMVGDGAPEA